jgi:capsular polysaccharide biosynthesis protein
VNLGAFQDRRSSLFRDALKSGWWIVLAAVLVCGVLGAAFANARPAKFSASSTVLVTQIIGNPFTPTSNTDTLEMLQTEAAAVTSDSVLGTVSKQFADRAEGLTAERLRARTVVTVPANTQTLRITYASNSSALAPDIVNAIASAYLHQRETSADAAKERTGNLIQSQLDELKTQIHDAKQDVGSQSATVKGLVSNLLELRAQLATTQAANTDPGHPLVTPDAAQGSQSKHVITFGIAGAILGLAIGMTIALWRERRLDRIRSAADLEDYDFDAPITAIDGDLDDDALRGIRIRLAPHIRDHAILSLVGMKPAQSLDAGVTLGRSLSRGGTSVVLVDGTGSDRAHRDPLGHGKERGLAEALMGDAAKPTAVRVGKNFGYVPAGQNAAAAAEHLVDDRARTVLHNVAEHYDLTLVAGMPLDRAEGEVLARLTEGVLLIVQLNATRHYDLGVALKIVGSQKHRLLGVFVLPATKKSSKK